MTRTTAIIAACAAAFTFAACGGDDDDSPPPATEPAGTEAPSPPDPDGPNATISPDLPEELDGEVKALEVRGTALPPLGQGTEIADDPALGMAAPVLVGQNFAGETVRVDAPTDGPTMVVFLAHWCPHCNREVPKINELRDDGAFPDSLRIVGVSTGINPGRPNWPPSEWFDDMDWTYPVIADGVDMQRGTFIGADAYGVDGFPFIALVDAEGNVVARWSGEREADEILANIETHLGL